MAVNGPTAECGSPAPVVSSKEVLVREFDDNAQYTGTVERCSGAGSPEPSTSCSDEGTPTLTSLRHTHERRKQLSTYSRFDMIRCRFYVESLRTPMKEGSGLITSRQDSQQLQDVIIF
uniref:Uncharacterized protein n=1 Tax=Physcomitrium patens TaxID=3218 RepID=A0A2K1IE32_PHYPA|nr:hypothetical protein PHYPA_029691 [Physcomitrium patens]